MRDVRAPWGCRAYFCVYLGLHLRLCARLCVRFVAVKGLYKLLRPQWLPVAAPVSPRWSTLPLLSPNTFFYDRKVSSLFTAKTAVWTVDRKKLEQTSRIAHRQTIIVTCDVPSVS